MCPGPRFWFLCLTIRRFFLNLFCDVPKWRSVHTHLGIHMETFQSRLYKKILSAGPGFPLVHHVVPRSDSHPHFPCS